MRLRNKSIFILGITRFDGSIESTSFTTAKFLAKDNDVYYIDFPYTFKDYVSPKNKKQFKNRRESFFSRKTCLLDTHLERLKILILPPLLSTNFLPEGNFYRFLLNSNERIIVNRVKSVIKESKIRDFIFINSFNFHYPNVGSMLGPNLLVYHCVDPLIVEYDKRHGLLSEQCILQKSDLIICTSKQLYKEKVKVNRNTYFIPNAADLTHCSTALDVSLPIFGPLKTIKQPIVGYFGNIERRIDYNLLQKVVSENPDKNFVFVGPVNDSYIPSEFKKLTNVFFLGKVAYKDMPSVLKGFDVAMIPFKKDEVSATIFPLKLFEYLGAGKAVVSTNFNPDLLDYTEDTVIYCEDETEFSVAIDLSLKMNLPEHREKRLMIASENTWDKRLLEFSKLLYNYYMKNNQIVVDLREERSSILRNGDD